MLNKIWASLIILGIFFAFAQDVHDEVYNTHNNGAHLQFNLITSNTSPQQLTLLIDEHKLNASLKQKQKIQIHLDANSPKKLLDIASANSQKNSLIADIISKDNASITLVLPEMHWQKIRDVTQAAFDTAEFAVKLALGLIGIMALWLGLMQIIEKSGLINYLVKFVRPLLSWLFPNIPKDHPALASISMNMTANILGLGNAATPLGIKAMQQLQNLNHNKDSASDEMCMFLALNTSSVQLLPPVTLIALMGTQVSELIVPIILATSCSTLVAVTVAKTFAARRYKKR
jgi:spore maturation protein A